MTSAQVIWDGLRACITLDRPVAIDGDEEPQLRTEIAAIQGIEKVVFEDGCIFLWVATSQHRSSVEIAMFILCKRGNLQPVRWQDAD
jgi:hypothetical protein